MMNLHFREVCHLVVTVFLLAFVVGILTGCVQGSEPITVPVVVTVEPPAKPALIAECKPEAVRKAVAVKKVPGDQTPVEATDKASATNLGRMRENAIAQTRCFCWLAANNLAVGVEPAVVEAKCKGVDLSKPMAAAKPAAKGAKKPS